ncbi:hypothetical protein Bca4012_030994 [Brassica carinata]
MVAHERRSDRIGIGKMNSVSGTRLFPLTWPAALAIKGALHHVISLNMTISLISGYTKVFKCSPELTFGSSID